MKPNSFTRANVLSELIKPMFGTLGRLDRADPPVMRGMNVADLKPAPDPD